MRVLVTRLRSEQVSMNTDKGLRCLLSSGKYDNTITSMTSGGMSIAINRRPLSLAVMPLFECPEKKR